MQSMKKLKMLGYGRDIRWPGRYNSFYCINIEIFINNSLTKVFEVEKFSYGVHLTAGHGSNVLPCIY